MNTPASLSIRELNGLGELALTPSLARAVWGEGDHPEDPGLLLAVQHIGGLVAGAVDGDGQLWAYLIGLPTKDAGIQHSHRLGVHPSARKQHLGEKLKRFQREWCLERGINQVRWTFDPLLLINAHLNIHRLGAVVRTFLPNYYGEMGGINAGAPSDRFEAEWVLGSTRAEAHLAGQPSETWPQQAFHPLEAELPATLPEQIAVRIPKDFYRLLREDQARALDWRLKTGPLFTRLFAEGYTLTDVSLSREHYLFERGAEC
ncbi:GNAT family N-acetyltransferase (plasmid) [Deinococcus psychrotolerans]|uniref:GNAT family N-acetyltransferase n=1 Tax=Deinococcus psychrotolerans TaxID=2489213 RepID=A0A3G8YSL6_9DEIO|nr:GNAT family N-acetyltransferase [Deinococcus psychrotolerans]AZI44721.1 GNAT family N-acetyltransferase [Deinococcus psychrotolerans]